MSPIFEQVAQNPVESLREPRVAGPQRKSLAGEFCITVRACAGYEVGKSRDINLVTVECESVAAGRCFHDAGERPAHARDERLQGRAGILGLVVWPDILSEGAICEHRAGIDREAAQERLLPAATHRKGTGLPRRAAEVGQPHGTTLVAVAGHDVVSASGPKSFGARISPRASRYRRHPSWGGCSLPSRAR